MGSEAARRSSLLTSRRRSSSGTASRLGAIKLQSPLGGTVGSDTGSPTSFSESETASAQNTPQTLSPLVAPSSGSAGPSRAGSRSVDSGHVAAAPAPAKGVAQFSRQLAADRSADRWFEEQSSTSTAAAKGQPQQQQQKGGAAVETAASQIVHKALRFITADSQPAAEAAKPSGTFDTSSFLDKGMDAIGSVGRLMEGFAVTLDTVIGHAFEDWGNNPSGAPGARPAPRRPVVAAGRSGTAAAAGGKENAGTRPSAGAKEAVGVPAAGVPAAGAAGVAARPQQATAQGVQQPGQQAAAGASTRQAHITSFMSKLDAVSEQEAAEWRKRAQQLARELQRMRAQQEEYQRLRLQYDKLNGELEQASSQASQLAQENSALKTRGVPPGAEPELADPLAAQQVARQMEALLTEKSKLAAENDRLLRENTGLQELLEFSLAHQSQLAADGDLFGYDDECEEDMDAAEAGMQALALGSAACSPEPSLPASLSEPDTLVAGTS